MRRAVRVPITPELFCQVFRFPDKTQLLEAEMSPDGRYLYVTLEHPALPNVFSRADLPVATPTFRRDDTDTEPVVRFVDWGLK